MVGSQLSPLAIKQALMDRIKGNDADAAAIDAMLNRGTAIGELCDFFNLTAEDRRDMGFPFHVAKPRTFAKFTK